MSRAAEVRWPLAVGAVLLGASQLVWAVLPDPPSAPIDVLRWAEAHRVAMELASELLIFSTVFLLAGLLPRAVPRETHPNGWQRLGAAALVMATVLEGIIAVLQGRLLYPIFGMELAPETAVLVTSLVYSAMHTATLMYAGGIILIGLAQGRGPRRAIDGGAGIAVGLSLIFGAFPWLTPTWVNVVAAVALMAWLLRLSRATATRG